MPADHRADGRRGQPGRRTGDGLLASIPNPLAIENGMITAPERPGHGLAFTPEAFKEFRVG